MIQQTLEKLNLEILPDQNLKLNELIGKKLNYENYRIAVDYVFEEK